jgi:hypothetical protein
MHVGTSTLAADGLKYSSAANGTPEENNLRSRRRKKIEKEISEADSGNSEQQPLVNGWPGVDAMLTIFGEFRQYSAINWRFFLKTIF